MGRNNSYPADTGQENLLSRAARLIVKRPRLIIGSWLLFVISLAVFGHGLEGKLGTRPILAEGTASKHAYELAVHRFGNDETVIILLSGPPLAVKGQGEELTRRLNTLPGTVVISPWSSAKAISGLRPEPRAAALLVSLKRRHGQAATDVSLRVERQVEATVTDPVRPSIGGGPPLVESFSNAIARAAAIGELIAIPVLLIVLVVVFRSILAAAIPIIIGTSVVAAARGVVALSSNTVNIDSFALGAIGMMGLALGVDYSLLVVSRFRESMNRGNDVAAAIQSTVPAIGRAVIPAGCGLILAMLAALLVLSNPLVVSVGFVVIVVTVLSVLSATLVVPSMLVVLGANLDRWSVVRRSGKDGVSWNWSQAVSMRPHFVWGAVFILLVCAGWAITLNTEAGNVGLLPPDDRGRQEQEAIQRALGPGWVAPIEIVVDGRGQPITEPHRLQALATFQRRFEGDPAVSTMAGLAPIEKSTRPLEGIRTSLATRNRERSQLSNAMSRTHHGLDLAASGVLRAVDGVGRLDSVIGSASGGAGHLAEGLDTAGAGTHDLTMGLGSIGIGSRELAHRLEEASTGSGHLTAALARARDQASEATESADVLKEALQAGDKRLDRLHSILRTTSKQLMVAKQSLESMTIDRDNAQYDAALEAVRDANERFTGRNASTGEQINPSFSGIDSEIRLAQNQFNFGIFLVSRAGRTDREARKGMSKLARGSRSLNRGLHGLTAGSQKIYSAITHLIHGSQVLSSGSKRLALGADRLAGGLAAMQGGATSLGSRLSTGARRLKRMRSVLGRTHSELNRKGSAKTGALLNKLSNQTPGMFRSGYFYLASLDGSTSDRRRNVSFLVNLDRGGTAARMLVIPRYASTSNKTQALTDRLQGNARVLEREIDAEIAVGGLPVIENDLNFSYRNQGPLLRLALMLVTVLVLIPVLRSLIIPIIAAFLNLVTVAASLGLLSVLFNSSLLGGPGYVDATVIPATVMLMFGLALDYEIFIFARMREEYVRTGSPDAAITNGLKHTAQVVSGAAIIMIAIFLAFAFSPFMTIRNFGVAQALAISVDAFVVRLVIVPALMRALGKWTWWMPNWLDRLLPGGDVT